MKINTKAVFEWNPKSKQYEEVYCDSYEYDGEVAECQYSMWGDPSGQTSLMQSRMGQRGYGSNNLQFNPGGQQFSGLSQQGFGSSSGWLGGIPIQQPTRPDTSNLSSYRNYGTGDQTASLLGDISGGVISGKPETHWSGGQLGGLNVGPAEGPGPSVPNSFYKQQLQGIGSVADGSTKAPGMSGSLGPAAMAGGALLGGITGFMQAKSQKKGLGKAIKELDPLKGKYMEAHERQLGLAEAYRPGGKYSRYMGGQIMSQAAESAGQESQRMVASGINSPSMMRAMARQSRRGAQAALPGMEMQLSQMALPYEQMGAQSLTQYGGVVEQLASLKGSKAAINPWASAISGGMQGMMGASSMMGSFS
jgi:hypothetical protein